MNIQLLAPLMTHANMAAKTTLKIIAKFVHRFFQSVWDHSSLFEYLVLGGSALETAGLEVVEAQDLDPALDTEMVESIGDLEGDKVILEREESEYAINTLSIYSFLKMYYIFYYCIWLSYLREIKIIIINIPITITIIMIITTYHCEVIQHPSIDSGFWETVFILW